MLGLGERAGNAALEEVAAALGHVARRQAGIVSRQLQRPGETRRRAPRAATSDAPRRSSAADVFTHESGIHVAALLKDARTYQALDPTRSRAAQQIVIGKHSGMAAITVDAPNSESDLDREVAARLLDHVRSWALAKKGRVSGELIRIADRAHEEMHGFPAAGFIRRSVMSDVAMVAAPLAPGGEELRCD